MSLGMTGLAVGGGTGVDDGRPHSPAAVAITVNGFCGRVDIAGRQKICFMHLRRAGHSP